MKLFVGIGIWRLAMEDKVKGSKTIKSSLQYEEEHIEEGNNLDVLRGKNIQKDGRIYPENEGQGDKIKIREDTDKEQ